MSQWTLYPAIVAATRAITGIYQPVIERCCQEFGISSQCLFILLAVPTFEPKPVSVEILNIRSPYTAPDQYQAILQELARKGYLHTAAEGQYRITSTGLDLLKTFLTAVYQIMGDNQSLPLIEQMDLASRLKMLADSCLAAPDPPGTWCIRHVRRMDPGTRVPMMARIDQFLSELQAFRDDAHLAAWRGIESNGHTWDILTHLWVHREANPDSIFQALARRGNSREQSLTAVELLIKRGWIKREGVNLSITSYGAELRQNAENTTDRYYLAPFKKFPAVQMEQTIALLEKLHRDFSTHIAGI